jgi:hypothetical protein
VSAARAAAYDNTQTNTYVGQSTAYYCGPASALMTLNSATVNVTPLPTQLALYNSIQAYQNGLPANQQTSYATSPDGMQNALATRDGARTYVAYNIASYDSAVRTMAYNVDHYAVPGAMLINRGAHWVDVFGVNTSVQPTLTNNFVVNGVYVRDPWTGFAGAGQGLGKYAYLANTANGLQRSFTPQGYGAWNFGKYLGNYAFVTDPDPDTQLSSAEPVITGSPVATSSAAAAAATSDEPTVAGLADDPSFESGSFDASPSDDMLMTLDNGGQDWLVPYDQTSDSTISGAFLIDAATGALDAAFFGDPSDRDSLANLDAEAFFDANSSEPDDITNDNEVPEPGSLVLLALGASGLLTRRRRV